jgi:hypothetical protein
MSGRGKPTEKRYKKPNEGALHVRQIPEWGEKLRVWMAMHARKWDYNGQKMGHEALVNALLLDFFGKPIEAQTAIVDRILPPTQEQERQWWHYMADLEARGLIESEPPYRPTKPDVLPIPEPPPEPKITLGKPTRPTKGPKRKNG